MARLTGRQGTAKVDTHTAGVLTEIKGITSWSIDYTGATTDTTGMEDSGIKQFLPTTTEWSGSFEGHWETAFPPFLDPALATSDIKPGLRGSLQLVAADGITTVTVSGECIYTGLSLTTATDAALDFTFSFQGTGELGIV